jgi:hypothetical protein
MNVVCFTLHGVQKMEDVRRFLNEVRDDGQVFFTPTIYKGVPAIRAAISNWQTTNRDIDLALEVLQRVADRQPAIA